MKRRYKILLILLAVVVVLQVPFVYRRYLTGRIAGKIAELESRRIDRENAGYNEYKGIIHAHTSLGGHSTGGFDELIAAANANDLDFVLMTEHYSDQYDTSALTLNGVYGKILFVGGNEIDTADGDRFLMIPGSAEAASLRRLPTERVVEKLHSENRPALVAYPERFKSWNADFDGIEVFSNHTQAKRANPLLLAGDLIWSYGSYPELTLMSHFRRPDDNLLRFDETAAKRNISLFPGTDAHSNIGFHLFSDDAGNKLINIKLDPYESTFRIVRAHVLLEKDQPLNRDELLAAIRAGRLFIGFDSLGDTAGFIFRAEAAGGVAPMGGEISAGQTIKLAAAAPQNARFVVFRNGENVHESVGTSEMTLEVNSAGAYRVEVYLDRLGPPFDREMPWIISNPIYVR